jgi:hypothetical protein
MMAVYPGCPQETAWAPFDHPTAGVPASDNGTDYFIYKRKVQAG